MTYKRELFFEVQRHDGAGRELDLEYVWLEKLGQHREDRTVRLAKIEHAG